MTPNNPQNKCCSCVIGKHSESCICFPGQINQYPLLFCSQVPGIFLLLCTQPTLSKLEASLPTFNCSGKRSDRSPRYTHSTINGFLRDNNEVCLDSACKHMRAPTVRLQWQVGNSGLEVMIEWKTTGVNVSKKASRWWWMGGLAISTYTLPGEVLL